jgi:hypothetical protein
VVRHLQLVFALAAFGAEMLLGDRDPVFGVAMRALHNNAVHANAPLSDYFSSGDRLSFSAGNLKGQIFSRLFGSLHDVPLTCENESVPQIEAEK